MNYIACLRADKTVYKLLIDVCTAQERMVRSVSDTQIHKHEYIKNAYTVRVLHVIPIPERRNGVVLHWSSPATLIGVRLTFKILRPTHFEETYAWHVNHGDTPTIEVMKNELHHVLESR